MVLRLLHPVHPAQVWSSERDTMILMRQALKGLTDVNGTPTILQAVVRRESRSLLLYIGDSFPWTTDEHASDLGRLRHLVKREANAISAVGKYHVRQRITPPFAGSYPASFTSCNFIDIAYLLPRLMKAQELLIADLTADIARVHEVDAKKQLEALFTVKQATLAGLAALLSSHTPTASA